jgi:hypothetical protein
VQQDVELEFIFGEPFVLGGFLEAGFFADNPSKVDGTIDGTTDLSNSATWQGISEIRDEQGRLVADPAVTSRSGVDWTQPVPEPGAMALACAAGASLLGMRLRRR